MKKDDKTNVMRVLDQKRINYSSYSYGDGTAVSGPEVAALLGRDPSCVFKTLVTVGKSGQHYVFVVPVDKELDLKLAASAASEKNIEMIKAKDLLPLTGYVHGGCSPIGMKKFFPTFVDISASEQPSILFSAGKIGHQVEIVPSDLARVIRFSYARLCG